MTHNELLAKIDINQELTDLLKVGLINGDIAANTARRHLFQSNALRAVVELHKPEHSQGGYRCTMCLMDTTYPCKTIQAIEKELK